MFGHACPDADRSETFIEHVSLVPTGGAFQLFSAQTAALRMLYSKCISLLADAGSRSLTLLSLQVHLLLLVAG